MQGLHLGQLLGMTFHPVLDATCTTFLFVAAMNAYNLIDGMDGIAGGLGCITAFGLCGLQVLQGNEGMAAVCVALAGACLGFLRYNFHPARIFLGDTGSMLIGFVLMAVTMAANNRSAALVMLVVPLLTMGIPMIDTALAIWRRSVRRAINSSSTGVSTADKDHLHHRLARRGFTQRKVAVLLYAMQALVFLIGLSWLFLRDYRTAIFSIAFLVGSYVLLRYLASLEMSDSGQWIVDGIRKPGGMQLYNSLMPFMDGMILSLALVAFSWLLSPNYPALQLNRLLRESAAPIIGCPLILIWLTRYYRPHWTRARALDYFYILVITSAGVLIGFALSPLSFKHDLRETLTFVILLMALTTPAMTFLRAFPRLVQDLVHYHERNRNPSHEERGRIRTLVYGAGYGYTLMVRAESFSKPEERRTYQLLGLIDDAPYLRGRLIHGHTVLGGIEDLPTLVEQKEVDELILSTPLEPERLDKVMQIAEEKNLRVRESVFRNNTLREPGQ
jgi:UDP-N-acetylmuramyl pentapeptide phosphotransferase/UDP-N-acetylglucosamine-1-phosphate transferase